jgi:hypothetical protein
MLFDLAGSRDSRTVGTPQNEWCGKLILIGPSAVLHPVDKA